MDDRLLIDRLNTRDESALAEIGRLYGRLCRSIARNILGSDEDAEECENDALLRVWNSIPPAEPDSLKAYVAMTARSAALNRYRASHAKKRGTAIPLDELCEISTDELDDELSARDLAREINRFLELCSREERYIFIRRYVYAETPESIGSAIGIGRSAVNLKLFRLRAKLKRHLMGKGMI